MSTMTETLLCRDCEALKTDTIRILLADDHPIIRQGLRMLLGLEDDFEVGGEAADGHQVIQQVAALDPDVLLLDLRMPNLDGLGTLRALRESGARTRVIILTASGEESELAEVMRTGSSGVVLKDSDSDRIIKAIRKVHAGEIWMDSRAMQAVIKGFSSPRSTPAREPAQTLSHREREIVPLIAQGHRNRDIAEKLFISEQTVKNHLHHIFDKLGVSDRLELALYAIHRGLAG